MSCRSNFIALYTWQGQSLEIYGVKEMFRALHYENNFHLLYLSINTSNIINII